MTDFAGIIFVLGLIVACSVAYSRHRRSLADRNKERSYFKRMPKDDL